MGSEPFSPRVSILLSGWYMKQYAASGVMHVNVRAIGTGWPQLSGVEARGPDLQCN